jgi:hypothetical protein
MTDTSTRIEKQEALYNNCRHLWRNDDKNDGFQTHGMKPFRRRAPRTNGMAGRFNGRIEDILKPRHSMTESGRCYKLCGRLSTGVLCRTVEARTMANENENPIRLHNCSFPIYNRTERDK